MDTRENEFVSLDEVEKEVGKQELKIRMENGRYIEFPIGQRIVINSYWFEIIGFQKENEIILKGIGMTKGYKKKFKL